MRAYNTGYFEYAINCLRIRILKFSVRCENEGLKSPFKSSNSKGFLNSGEFDFLAKDWNIRAKKRVRVFFFIQSHSKVADHFSK